MPGSFETDFVALVRVKAHDGGTLLDVNIEPKDWDTLDQAEWRLRASYAHLGRLRVSSGGETRERWCGSEAGLYSMRAIDDLPWFPAIPAPTDGRVDLEVELRFDFYGDSNELVSRVEVGAGVSLQAPFAEARIPLTERAVDGPPFADPEVIDVPAAVGPYLPATAVLSPLMGLAPFAVLPDVGILTIGPPGTISLVTREGIQPLPGFPPIERFPSYMRACTAGPGGVMAMIWGAKHYELTLSLFGPPALLARRDVFGSHGDMFTEVEGRFDPTGQTLVAPVSSQTLGAFDARRGQVRWRRDVHASARDLAMDVTQTSVAIAGAGQWHVMELASGASRQQGWVPQPRYANSVAIAETARRYAFAEPFSGPPLDRGVVAWHDLDTARGGQVIVPDAFIDARLAVLDDGRILATGTSTWLVDPERGTAARIAPRLLLPARPLITRAPAGFRVWTMDPQRWYLEIPPR